MSICEHVSQVPSTLRTFCTELLCWYRTHGPLLVLAICTEHFGQADLLLWSTKRAEHGLHLKTWSFRCQCLGVGNMPNSTWLRHARWKQKLQIQFNHVCFSNLARIMSTCWHLLNPLGGIRVIPCCVNQENCKYTPKQEFIYQVLIVFKAWPWWNSHFPYSWFWIIHDQPFYFPDFWFFILRDWQVVSLQLFLLPFPPSSDGTVGRACRNGNITETM